MVLPADERLKAKERIKRRVDAYKEGKPSTVPPAEIPVEEGEQVDGE